MKCMRVRRVKITPPTPVTLKYLRFVRATRLKTVSIGRCPRRGRYLVGAEWLCFEHAQESRATA